MHIRDLNGKNVCILGFGREGQAMLAALRLHTPECEITIADQNEHITVDDAHCWKQIGTGWLENLEKFDVLIKSPGIPPTPQIDAQSSKLTSSTQIFFDSIKDTGATVIGVTGSKGKSTTSSLMYHILKAGHKEVYLVGNIGKPAIEHIADAKADTIFVLEMSSYQLMDMTVSPHIAIVTSFFPEHLDYHGSLQNYLEAKMHITKFQSKDDTVFYAHGFDGTKQIADKSPGQKIPYSLHDAPVALSETTLIGEHNLQNIGGAFLVSKFLGIDANTAIEAIKNFTPLPHRLQMIGTFHNIQWIDDAISTTPESTMAALDALGDQVSTLIVGGQNRGYDFEKLAARIAESHIQHIIAFPGSGPSIVKAIQNTGSNVNTYEAWDMKAVVEIAKRVTEHDKICLLSTASPSYNIFKNFEDKGDQFAACIRA